MQRLWQAVRTKAGKLFSAVEELIWPRGFQCLCCEKQSYGESLCADCRKSLEDLRLKDLNGDIRSAWKYAGCAKHLVSSLKFSCSADCAQVLAAGIADVISHMRLPADTTLTWVTMPEQRRRERGIDHGMELCRCVSQITGMEMRQLLQRAGKVKTQRGLNKVQRSINLNRSFSCCDRISGSVLVVDDVLTTGATICACREVLIAAGADHVYAVTATSAELKSKQ